MRAERNKNDLLPTVIDYAAGSGHFITESMEVVQNYIDNLNESSFNPTTKRAIKKWKEDQFDWAEQYVYKTIILQFSTMMCCSFNVF